MIPGAKSRNVSSLKCWISEHAAIEVVLDVAAVTDAVAMLTDGERLEVLRRYCAGCGGKTDGCCCEKAK